MARMENNNLSGAVGSLIFYTRDGKNYVRSKPGKRKKKRGQPASSNNTVFGRVSGNCSRMLKQLQPALLFKFGLYSYNNARGWMRNQYAANQQQPDWEISTRPNDMCQLNAAADLRDMLFVSVTVKDTGGGILQVSIPAMNPFRDMKKMPAGTVSVNLKLAVLYSAFEEDSPAFIAIEQYLFDYKNTLLPAKEISVKSKAPAGNLAFIVLAIEPVAPNTRFEQEWLPAAIIGMGRIK